MNISYDKSSKLYMLGNTTYTKDEFLAYIESDMLQAALATNTSSFDVENSESKENDREVGNGTNILFYGVPGAGKSHIIDKMIVKENCERVVFHPDYTYSDFVGQILPRLNGEKLGYVFELGPFTQILKKAYENQDKMYYLVIEEINRGNAPAIFGDIFQLLDRNDDGTGKYEISNYDMATAIFKDDSKKIRIPSNLSIFATMNTSDQNVFTLDTAFQRRWEMRLVKNSVESAEHSNNQIERSIVSWGKFATVTNLEIMRVCEEMGSSADKRLGAYFARPTELGCKQFPEKVLKYLWDDAFKMDHYAYFNDEITSLDEIIDIFNDDLVGVDPLKRVLRHTVYTKMIGKDIEYANLGSSLKESGANDEEE